MNTRNSITSIFVNFNLFQYFHTFCTLLSFIITNLLLFNPTLSYLFSFHQNFFHYLLLLGSFHIKVGQKNQFLHPPIQIFLKFTPLIHIPGAKRNAKFLSQNLIPSKVMAFYILGQNTHISPCGGHFGFS